MRVWSYMKKMCLYLVIIEHQVSSECMYFYVYGLKYLVHIIKQILLFYGMHTTTLNTCVVVPCQNSDEILYSDLI